MAEKNLIAGRQPALRRQPNLFARIWAELKKNHALYVLLILPVAVLIIFKYVPMYGVQIAFRNYKPARGIYGSDWVGLKYFGKYISSMQFWPLIRNTLSINLYSLATFPFSLILALLLNYVPSKAYRKTVQMVSYAPHFVSTVVVCSMVVMFSSYTNGLFNNILVKLGFERREIITDPNMFVPLYVWSGVWQNAGFSSIIYIAALSSVDTQLYDAAKIDGANRWQRVVHIEFPVLVPTIMILLIMNMGGILNVGFDKVFLMQNTLNLKASQVISTYVYDVGVKSSQFSFGTAVGLFTNIVNFIFLLTANWVSKKITGSGLM